MGHHTSSVHFCPECRRNALPTRKHGHTKRLKCGVCGAKLVELSEERRRWLQGSVSQEEAENKRGNRYDKPKKWLDESDELDKICSIKSVQQLLEEGPEPKAGERDHSR